MLLTEPARKNVKNFLEKIRGTLREMRAARQEDVIDKLNPVIRGWANYHRSQMATRTFAKTDHLIWRALWRWARRRHPNKGERWIKARYFRGIAGRDWRFADKDKALSTLTSFHKKEAPRQDRRQPKSVQPGRRGLLRRAPRAQDGVRLEGPPEAGVVVVLAGRTVSVLQPEDHENDGVAHPPRRQAIGRRVGTDEQPSTAPSELSSAAPRQRVSLRGTMQA